MAEKKDGPESTAAPAPGTPAVPVNESDPPSFLRFKNPLPGLLADQVLAKITEELVPILKPTNPGIFINPIFHEHGGLAAIDFGIPLSATLKSELNEKIRRCIYLVQREETEAFSKSGDPYGHDPRKPISFTELLGTYRVALNRFYLPIFACIFFATIIGWLATYPAGLEIDASIIQQEEPTVWGVILNALLPVLFSAVFITIIWLVVRKYGLNAFKYIFGFLVLFYVWFGFSFVVDVVYIVLWDTMARTVAGSWFFYILYYGLYIGSAAILIWAGVLFVKNRLVLWQKNAIVLLFGIFLGSIIGISFPTWTTLMFAIFLSLWDLFAVFKGPLGKIAGEIMQNRQTHQTELQGRVERGEISREDAEALGAYSSVQTAEIPKENAWSVLADIEIELGSGDLILYSALVAHVFIRTLSWLVTGLVMAGVMAGAIMTLFLLVKKKRVLPALPFSMFFGVLMYLIGTAIIAAI